MKVGIIGAGGYAGGELLRLLSGHPEVREIVAGSESLAGKPVTTAHPNLRKRTSLQFVPYDDVSGCDVLFLSLPNGAHRLGEFRSRATLVIDLSSDHRLRDRAVYAEWYDEEHPHPELLGTAVYGMPELHRDDIRTAKLLTGAGCNATATILAILPLARADLVDPFVRIVKERSGIFRYPEPKLLAGSNFADVGFAVDPRGERVVALCAIDNLVKGAAGNGVQAMNVACGFAETAGLEFPGLHP